MEEKLLKSGWQILTSDTGHRYLYSLVEVKDMAAGLKVVESAVNMTTTSGLSGSSHFSLDDSAVTISLNTPAKIDLNDTHFALAQQINTMLA